MKKHKPNYKQDFPELIRKLENMIIIGAFMPKERLIEADLAQQLSVSRAWIRDALKILETKGLVKVVPYRGAMVADLTEQEVNEIFEVRLALEKLCNKLAADNFRPEHAIELKNLSMEIEKAYHENRFDMMISANTDFHNLISEISKNAYLIEILKQVRSRYYIFNTFAWSHPETVEKILSEHREFIESFENKNYEKLEELSESHIKYSKDIYINHLRTRKF